LQTAEEGRMGKPDSESRPFAGDRGFALDIPLKIKREER